VRAKASSESSSSSQFRGFDLPVGEDLSISLADHLRHLGGALPWSAGEEEQRIGLRIAADRRQDDDIEIDLAAGLRGTVLVDL
jgi:hypothetical protein